MLDKIKKLLIEREEIKEEYFDAKKYRISTFVLEFDRIFDIYDLAQGSAELMRRDTTSLDCILSELKKYKGEQVLTISIDPIHGKGEDVTILTDPEIKNFIGIYKKEI